MCNEIKIFHLKEQQFKRTKTITSHLNKKKSINGVLKVKRKRVEMKIEICIGIGIGIGR